MTRVDQQHPSIGPQLRSKRAEPQRRRFAPPPSRRMQLVWGGLVIGVCALSTGVTAGGAAHAAPPSPPDTAPQPAAGAGLRLASTSKVRVLAGRETKFWLEGERADAVTSVVFEFPSASGVVRVGPVDGAGSPDRPAVTHVFDVVGAGLPVVVTVTIDGATERFETTLEVVAVDTVGQEIEPPPRNGGSGSASQPSSSSGDLPEAPEGAVIPGSDDVAATTAANGVPSGGVDPESSPEGSPAKDSSAAGTSSGATDTSSSAAGTSSGAADTSSSAAGTSSGSGTPAGGGSPGPVGALLAPVAVRRRRDLELVDERGNPVDPRLAALEAERARIDGLDAVGLETEGKSPDDEFGGSPDLRDGLSFTELYVAYRRSRSAEEFVGLLVARLVATGSLQVLEMDRVTPRSAARRQGAVLSASQIDAIVKGLANTDDPVIAYLLKMIDMAKGLQMTSMYGASGPNGFDVNTGGRSRENILDDLLKVVAPELLVGKQLDGSRGGAIVGSLGSDAYVAQGNVADSTVGLLQGDDKALLLGRISNSSVGLGAGNDSLEGLFGMSGGTINADGGDDSIDVTGRFEKAAISGDEGNDTIAVRGELSDTTINGDLGNDTIAVGGNGTRNRINGRDGDDKIAVGGNLTATMIDLGPGIDELVIADNFRGSLMVIDPDISRINKKGENLREQDSLLLQGNGWVKIADRVFERRDAAGNVIASVSLGGPRPDAEKPDQRSAFFGPSDVEKFDEIEFVGVVVDGQVRDIFRNIAPAVDQDFLDGLLSWVRPILTVAAIVTTGGAASTVALASGVVNTVDAVANNNPFGAVLGLASIVAPAVSIDGAPALGKTISDVSNGIKTGTALVQSGFNPTALLGTLSYTLGATGNPEGAIVADVVQTVGTAVKDGKLTLDAAIGLFSTGKRINDLAQAQQAARQQGFADDVFINSLLYPDDPVSRTFWQRVGLSPLEEEEVQEWSTSTDVLKVLGREVPRLYAQATGPGENLPQTIFNTRTFTWSPPGSPLSIAVTVQVGQRNENGDRPLFVTVQAGASTTPGTGFKDKVSVSPTDPNDSQDVSSKVAVSVSVPGGKADFSVNPTRLIDLSRTGSAKDVLSAELTAGFGGVNYTIGLKGSFVDNELVWDINLRPGIGPPSPTALGANLTGSVTFKISPDLLRISDALLDNLGTPIPGITEIDLGSIPVPGAPNPNPNPLPGGPNPPPDDPNPPPPPPRRGPPPPPPPPPSQGPYPLPPGR
jgi:hypothetical protein